MVDTLPDVHHGQTNGTPDLQERLHEPEIAASLDRLLSKIEKIEQAINRLEDVVMSAPGMVSMAADTFDDVYREVSEQGIQLEERARVGASLLMRLTDPSTAGHLENLLDRVETLSATLEQAPNMVSMAADTVDNIISAAAANGIDVEQRLRISLELLERLTEPKTAATLTTLMDNMDKLEAMLEQGPGVIAMALDTVDDMYRGTISLGINPEAVVKRTIDAASSLADLVQSDEVKALMESGMLDPRTLTTLGHAATALVESRDQQRKIGPVGLLQALGDPSVQYTLGFLITFGQRFGQSLSAIDSNNNGHSSN